MKADLLTGKFSLCLSKADAKVSKGKAVDTVAADTKCESKFVSGWEKTREKAQDKDATLGADCDGAMSNAVRDSVEASALIAAGRDLTFFAVTEADLAAGSSIPNLIEAAVAAVCETAGGSWDSGTCTAGSSVSSDNCTIVAMCSALAAEYPSYLNQYTNNHVGATPTSTGCAVNAFTVGANMANTITFGCGSNPLAIQIMALPHVCE
ncbi:MAG: hypothetical protein ABGY42_11155 [bacterium]